MERSIGEIVAFVAVAAVGLTLVGFLGFAFMFGAADNTEVTLEAQPLSAAGVVEDVTYTPPEAHQPIVDRTIANGSSRTVSLDSDPFFDAAPAHQVHGQDAAQSVYVERGGTFYRIDVANTATVETRRQTLELVAVNETGGDVIAFDELPVADRRVVSEAYAYRQRGCDSASQSDRDPPCWRPYSSRAANASMLVPTPRTDYVRYENRTFDLVVRERTVDGTAITYRATPVANDSAAFRAQFVTPVDETDLTDGERQLLQVAIDEGYHIQVHRHDLQQVPRERFNSLLPKLGLPTLDVLSRGHHGSEVGYIEYRGVHYRVQVEYSDTYV